MSDREDLIDRRIDELEERVRDLERKLESANNAIAQLNAGHMVLD